jgi:ribonucleotide monophosphatase NagD (HAD superfamily)
LLYAHAYINATITMLRQLFYNRLATCCFLKSTLHVTHHHLSPACCYLYPFLATHPATTPPYNHRYTHYQGKGMFGLLARARSGNFSAILGKPKDEAQLAAVAARFACLPAAASNPLDHIHPLTTACPPASCYLCPFSA